MKQKAHHKNSLKGLRNVDSCLLMHVRHLTAQLLHVHDSAVYYVSDFTIITKGDTHISNSLLRQCSVLGYHQHIPYNDHQP